MSLDRLILIGDRALRTLALVERGTRRSPAAGLPEGLQTSAQFVEVASLMRVNHAGEVCAQALYDAQALLARQPKTADWLRRAAAEEADHLAWTRQRVQELGGRVSCLNPVWYVASFLIGAGFSAVGDRWSMGFLQETERQVVSHLESHLARLPAGDARSRAIVTAMRDDEARHADSALVHGAAVMPPVVRELMHCASRVMVGLARRI